MLTALFLKIRSNAKIHHERYQIETGWRLRETGAHENGLAHAAEATRADAARPRHAPRAHGASQARGLHDRCARHRELESPTESAEREPRHRAEGPRDPDGAQQRGRLR